MRTKIPAILLICFLSIPNLLATELASNQDRERPISFVSDPSNWLTRETRDSLENHLWKRSNELGAEVFVLLEATPGNSLDTKRQFLKKLGDSWSEKNWAIVSCRPNQIGAPIVVSGGPFQREIDKRFWDNEISLMQNLSLQAWHQTPDIDLLAREVCDTIVFTSRVKDATIQILAKKRNEGHVQQQRTQKERKALLTTVVTTSLLALLVGLLLLRKIYLSHRKMKFPSTHWSPRLGAPHSGGSAITHCFHPPGK